MSFQKLFHILLGAVLAAVPALASPYSGLSRRDLFVPSTTCDDFVTGAEQTKIGQVCVGISGGTVTITYPTLTSSTYTDIHVYIGTSAPTSHIPGSFPYTLGNGACTISADKTTATCSIPVQSSWRVCGKTLYIATHASLANGSTGWGKGTCFDSPPPNNCAKYWTFTTECQCPVVVDYEPITSTTVCVTTIMTTITSIVTPSPTSTITTCDDPNSGSATSTITTTTTTSFELTCPTTNTL
ncbi:hypothetical protein Forpi1262_v016159 [Fusarium oxysporum f. sp. raphani]|uniref:Uncharacterized protein n=1 Tax=Fusarium oxysporum f. sp. raphani TaxID=96318 RepID=A0A8J5UDT7_FUSOX|nr:hypothetical protein Forpi1262_v016159 [Fusarium oxysporum f. sp. raphani]